MITYPVSIGRMDWRSPLGQTFVAAKVKHPSWYPPESIRKEHAANGDPLPKVVRPGPKNPLGEYKMRLAVGDGTYEIHGTNNPLAVGMAITRGCIRMYPEDGVGFVRGGSGRRQRSGSSSAPVKVAYVDGDLLVEAHPPVDAGRPTRPSQPNLELLSKQLDHALEQQHRGGIRCGFAREALQAATGMPTLVGLAAEFDPTATAAAEGRARRYLKLDLASNLDHLLRRQTEAVDRPGSVAIEKGGVGPCAEARLSNELPSL